MRDYGEKYNLVLENVDTFRLSYAKTLKLWRERFLERWPMIAPLGYDDEFKPQVDLLPELLRSRLCRRLDRRGHLPVPQAGLRAARPKQNPRTFGPGGFF